MRVRGRGGLAGAREPPRGRLGGATIARVAGDEIAA